VGGFPSTAPHETCSHALSLLLQLKGLSVFNSRASLKSLMTVCQSLSTMLDSGVDVKKAFELAGRKIPDLRMRKVMQSLELDVREGSEIATAMEQYADYLPRLLIDMVAVGETTGALPEVLRSLAAHYESRLRLRRDFIRAIAWPAFQFFAAVFVIALLIYIMGWIAETRGGGIDVLGFGLIGARGALVWLGSVFGTLLVVYVVYQILNRSLGGKQLFDESILKIPVVGTCARAFAIARFSWGFSLTQGAGMPIKPSLEASLRATSNGAFIAATPAVWNAVREGEFLADALAATRLFPEDYIHMVQVAEDSGTVPEALARMSPQFEDQARRSLSMLASTLGWGVWAVVAMFIIFFIFRLAGVYVGAIEDNLQGTF
jgi:type IV pilus assembly protein PilC